LITTILATSCKKEKLLDSISNNVEPSPTDSTLAYNGEISSTKFLFYSEIGAPPTATALEDDYTEEYVAGAGFINNITKGFQDAGNVTINGTKLNKNTQNEGVIYFGAAFSTDGVFFNKDNKVDVVVEGNSQNKIEGFSYSDNITFPSLKNYSLPISININKDFTLNYEMPSGVCKLISIHISGTFGEKEIDIEGAGNGKYIISSSILKSVSKINSEIFIEVEATNTEIVKLNNKNYRFVKRYTERRSAATE
jgi:hypothetical protein